MANLSYNLDELLTKMVELGGSDLHLRVGLPPLVRIRGRLTKLDYPPLEPEDTETLMFSILNEERKQRFLETHELDMAYALKGVARFRTNIFRQQGYVGGVLRCIPFEILTLEKLGLPTVVRELVMRPRGLFLVTGPTGSGKTTTLAGMIRHINENSAKHIVTIEDPIEFVHDDIKSIVQQREVGEDTHSFQEALRRVLRQAPDVTLVGELRDLETIHLAITAAETGHLVFGTLHTTDAVQTVDRAIDVFPPNQQAQIRMQLSVTLLAIICQQLLPTADGKGRVAAFEIMVATPAIRSLIREGKTHQLPTEIQSGGELGMQSLDSHLAQLLQWGKVKYEDALAKCSNPREFEQRIQKLQAEGTLVLPASNAGPAAPPSPGAGPQRR
ncbi:MAG: type IV pilus twitching motility protein PilT [Armatimonadetes bacterium]|nr:type IV pilus twitching motility protein PilT [Armatimonadota bacterium]